MPDWIQETGRNEEGDKYVMWFLVDKDKRVLADISCPTKPGTLTYESNVYMRGLQQQREYFSLDSAKAYCEQSASVALELESIDTLREKRFIDRERSRGWMKEKIRRLFKNIP